MLASTRAAHGGVVAARPRCGASIRASAAMAPATARPLRRRPIPRRSLTVMAAAGVAHPGEEAAGEKAGEGGAPRGSLDPARMAAPDTTMAKGGGGGANFGSGGSLGMTMERSKLQFVMPTPPQQSPKLDDGGSGGDIGKNINNGGGGGDDGGDDDDYFNDGEDPEGEGGGGAGDGFFRTAIPEQYDRVSVGVVLAEWYKTIADLPLFIRRAVEMGLFSSAQLVRFLSMDVRPNMARGITRTLPPEWARSFVGRMMADPAFTHKLVLEQLMAFAASMVYEARVRGDRFRAELDLAVINSVGLAAAVGASVWITAPSRAYGSVHKFPWQSMLAALPHCVFDASGPLRSYTRAARLGGFFASMAQLSAVGALAGGATALAGAAAVRVHQQLDPAYAPSTPPPDAARSSAGLGAFFAVNANTRYQLLGGMDRYLFGHSSFMWTYLLLSGVARGLSCAAGEASRAVWQGLPGQPAWQQQPAAARRQTARVKRVVRRKKAGGRAAGEEGVVGAADDAASAAGPLAASASSSSSSSSSAAAASPGAAAAAAAAAVAVAGSAAAASSSQGQQQQQQQQEHAGELGSSGGGAPSAQAAAAAAALQAYQPISAGDGAAPLELQQRLGGSNAGGSSLEASLEARLTGAPGVVASSPEAALEALLSEPSLQHQPSLSDTAMGMALRDAVGQAVH